MNLSTKKLQLIEYLINCQDEKLFDKIEATIKDSQQQEFTKAPFSQKQMVERAKLANEDYLSGRYKTQKQLKTESETW
jgi:hypothetical protein